MTSATLQPTLDGRALDGVQSLIGEVIEGSCALREAAAAVNDSDVSAVLADLAARRHAQSEDLARLVVRRAEDRPDTSLSASGALRRGWSYLRAAFSLGDPDVILAEVEHAEMNLRKRYCRALRLPAKPPAALNVLVRHYLDLKRDRQRLLMLRRALALRAAR